MKAVGYRQNGPIDRPDVLIDLELEPPPTQVVSPINAANPVAAHATLESGMAIGKIVLTDWA